MKTTDEKKVGIVTFFRGNYGSILQCYATCETLKDLGYSPCVVDKKANRFANIIRFVIRCLAHPRYVKTFVNIRNKAFSGGARISNDDRQAMNEFINDELPVARLSASKLKAIGKDKNYVAFVSGSDQIWGGHEYIVDPVRFLRFAPKNKRIAWAPSFGTTDVAQYNKRAYKKYISQYSFLSVREPSAADIVKELTGKTPTVLMDPVYLLPREKWLSFATKAIGERYVLCYFLDRPSDSTISQINEFSEKNNVKVVAFGPWNDCYQDMNVEHLHGDPKTFVSLIANAKCVFTDSFHALSFSLILNTQFFVYRRNYAHGIDQSSRIKAILEKTAMLQYFEPNTIEDIAWDFSIANSIIEKDRTAMLEYLTNSLSQCTGEKLMEKNDKIVLKDANKCVGCGACLAICPRGALIKKKIGYTWVPVVDEKLCVNCGLCQSVCAASGISHTDTKQAYIAYNLDPEVRLNSASGGVFSALATYVLQNGGSVFGAALRFDEGKAIVEHLRVTEVADLPLIMGSKYVQSDASKSYRTVKEDLVSGKRVLFSGCSCQIAGLKNYLKNTDQSNLYTLDLICHGVPSIDLFNDYIKWIEKKYKGAVTNLTFRSKRDGKIIYELTIEIDNSRKIVVPIRDSGYYRMFIEEEGYRNACYSCEYASLDKPADVTTGDYFEATKDYPQLFSGEDAIDRSRGISCLIAHNQKGKDLLQAASKTLFLHEVDPKVVQASHGNLHRPSKHSWKRNLLKALHKLFGYGAIENFYKLRNKLVDLIRRK